MKSLPAIVCLASLASAQSTTLMTTSTAGVQTDDGSLYAELSADMRFLTWQSVATTLVLGDVNAHADVIVREIATGLTTLASLSSAGTQGDGDSLEPEISADGRYVVFFSYATNLVPGDTNNTSDIFLRDRLLGTTECISVGPLGEPANGGNRYPTISHDGRYVAWESNASNLVAGDSNGVRDIFVRDRQLGLTQRVSVDSAGAQGDGASTDANLSPDGRFVAFESDATNLVPGDTNAVTDVFLHDLLTGATQRVSTTSSGTQASQPSNDPYVSDEGRFVAFDSRDANFVPGDANGQIDIFVKDMLTGTIERCSLSSAGIEADWDCYDPVLSPDGQWLVYFSLAGNLVPNDTNNGEDIFLRDRAAGLTERVSVGANGQQASGVSFYPAVSPDGRFVAFDCSSDDLVANDSNGLRDIFLRDRLGSFHSFCSGDGSLATACPCSNTGATGRGCDNSLASGGVQLLASGTTLPDSVRLTTSGEPASALSIFLQGDSIAPPGIVFGDGVRCVAGALKRLYVHNAVAGSASAPHAGELPIHLRSAALGDPFPPGATRWYQVYYRDPNASFCPSATFNVSNGVRVGW
ncbi:MAG: PD40 domain-containing protein [Planctomycetes bacterium]|nr:PD40 domain-containing protein [Planctomycetota bacterium]